MRLRNAARILSAICMAASPALAEDWNAIVVGQSAPSAPKAFADAFHASEALRANGFESVQMLRDASVTTVQAAIDALQDRPRAVFYYSGPQSDDQIQLKDGQIGMADLVGRIAQSGVTEIALLVEDCADPTSTSVRSAMPALPTAVDVYLAASAGPGVACASVPERMTEMLREASGASLQEVLRGAWTETSLSAAIPLGQPGANEPAVASAPVISVVSNDVVALSPVSAPVQAAPALAPVSPTPAAARPQSSGTVVIFEPPPQSQLAAIPVRAGLPEPSIIVGLIAPTDASFDTVTDPGEVTSSEISYDNLEARRRLRSTSPDLFETLVASGAFDPPSALLATALQTELSRMGCYTVAIDGIWGGGSRRSVERYFGEIPNVSAVSLEPDIPLFRQIIRQDDIVCRVPQAAPVARAPAQSQPARRSQPAAAAPARRAAPQPAPAPRRNTGRTIQSGRSLGGVFR